MAPRTVIARTPTAGLALDVKTDGRLIYVAEGRAGISIWELTAAGLSEVSRYRAFSQGACRQIVLLGRTGLAAVQPWRRACGAAGCLHRPRAPLPGRAAGGRQHVLQEHRRGAVRRALLCGRAARPGHCLVRHRRPDAAPESAVSIEQQLCTIEEGAALGPDGVFTIFRGRYAYSRCVADIPGESGAMTLWDEQDGAQRRPVYLSGRPTLIDDRLCLLNRQTGQLTLIDVADPDRPRVVRKRLLSGHPEQILRHKDAYWVCCGHGGLQRVAL